MNKFHGFLAMCYKEIIPRVNLVLREVNVRLRVFPQSSEHFGNHVGVHLPEIHRVHVCSVANDEGHCGRRILAGVVSEEILFQFDRHAKRPPLCEVAVGFKEVLVVKFVDGEDICGEGLNIG